MRLRTLKVSNIAIKKKKKTIYLKETSLFGPPPKYTDLKNSRFPKTNNKIRLRK